nr:uncharacterized protein LOC129267593 [Lytechinus pictus]
MSGFPDLAHPRPSLRTEVGSLNRNSSKHSLHFLGALVHAPLRITLRPMVLWKDSIVSSKQHFERNLITANGEFLPIALLGIRTTVKEDLGCTPAELVYGTTLKVPGQLLAPTTPDSFSNPGDYVHRLRNYMIDINPARTRSQTTTSHVPPDLQDCSHVFIRCDAVRPSLQPQYDGPYRVVSRTPKFFILDVKGKNDSVSVDRLKVAHLPSTTSMDNSFLHHASFSSLPTPTTSTPPVRTTRSGRRVHFPARFAQFSNG